MAHWFLSFLACLILSSTACIAKEPFLKEPLACESAILINGKTGKILYQKNARMPLSPASTTKVATFLYALHLNGAANLDEMLTATQETIGTMPQEARLRSKNPAALYYLEPDSTHMGIKKGEILSLRDLYYGLMLISASDAANMLAKRFGGTISDFVAGMNNYLKKLGCRNTFFVNPHGNYHPDHLTTAYDLALITREAMKYPFFRQVVSTLSHMRPKTNMQEPTKMVQGNRLLHPRGPFYFPKAIGVKTGAHSQAKSCLVAAAEDGDRLLIAVVLKSPTKAEACEDAIRLFEAALGQKPTKKRVANRGQQAYKKELRGASKPLATYIAEDLDLEYFPAEESNYLLHVEWLDPLALPIRQGQQVATLHVVSEEAEEGELLAVPLYAAEAVNASLFSRISQLAAEASFLFWGAAAGGAGLLFFLVKRARRRRA